MKKTFAALTPYKSVTQRNAQFGLTVVVIPSHGQTHTVPPAVLRLAIEASLYAEAPELGIKACRDKRFTALWAGSKEELTAIRRMYSQKPDHMVRADVVSLGEFEYDWLNGPGNSTIARHVETEVGLVTFFCCPAQGITPLGAATLSKLRQQAQQQACHVLALIVVPAGQLNVDELRGMVDRAIVFKPCEADPDWAWAVSAEFVSRGYFDVAHPKTMCQLSFRDMEYPRALFEPFLHDELVTRVQWHMRKHGARNKDIADAFDVSGSTITRALQLLPKYPTSWKSEDEVEAMLAFVTGEENPSSSSSKKPAKWAGSDLFDGDDLSILDDGDEDDDCDITHVPKKSAKMNKRL